MNKIHYIKGDFDVAKNLWNKLLLFVKRDVVRVFKSSEYQEAMKTLSAVGGQVWSQYAVRMFNNEGAVDDYSKWQPLTLKWLSRKRREGKPTLILQYNQNLINAVIEPSVFADRESISITFPNLPYYAHYHLEGTYKMPRRNFLRLSDSFESKFYEKTTDILGNTIFNEIEWYLEQEVLQ